MQSAEPPNQRRDSARRCQSADTSAASSFPADGGSAPAPRGFIDEVRAIRTKWFVYHPHKYGIATLMRIGVRLFGRQLLLHHFRPHTETEYHDHPWDFRTLVLWGSYVDWSLDQQGRVRRDRLRPLSTRHRAAAHAHRTSCKGHVWTLVLTSRKRRQWCKGTPGRWVCDGEVQAFDATLGMVKVR